VALGLQGCVGRATPEPVNAPVPTVQLSAPTEVGKGLQARPSTDPAKLYPEAPSNSPTPLPAPVATPAPRLEGGMVVEGGLADWVTLNPMLADDPTSLAIIELLFDRLLAVDPQTGSLRPGLASSWQVSADGLTLTFTLRDDVLWHDGQPFSAADVEFTFKAIANPAVGSPRRQADFSLVEEFKAIDDTTFVVTLVDADCSILYDLGSVSIVPRHILGADDNQTSHFNANPTGTGPFMFGEWVVGDHVTLLRNPSYWGEVPQLDAWTYKVVANEETLLAGLEADQLDVIPLPLGDLTSVEAAGRFQIHRYPANEYYFIGYNTDHPILGDVRVRRALSQAVDRQRLLDRILGGQGQLLETGLLPAHWAYPQELVSYPFDLARAAQLLAEASWVDSDGDGIRDRDGEPLILRLTTNGGNPTREAIAILAQQYYLAVGVAAEVELTWWGNFLENTFTHDFDVVIFSWPLALDPDGWELWHSSESVLDSGFNFVSYHNPRVDELLLQGLRVPQCETARRATIYDEIATILAEDQPYTFLFAPYNLIAVNERVGGVAPSPFAGLHWNLADWYVTR